MNGLSLIIPALNEEQGIGRVLDGLDEVRAALGVSLETIVVDDGSSDRTGEIAKAKGAAVVRHPVNLGYGASLKDGIRRARYDWIGIIDADGSYDISELGKLLKQADEYDMVVGARQGSVYRGTFLSYPMRLVFHWLCAYVTGVKLPDANSGFRLFRKSIAVRHFPVLSQRFSFTTSLTMVCLLEGCVVGFVPIRYLTRVGKSKVRPFKDSLRASQILFEVVVMYNPVKAFLVMGLAPFLIGAAFACVRPWVFAMMSGFAFLIWSLGGIGVLLSRRNREA